MFGPQADGPLVRAAGGVVWRRDGASVQIVLVHRPRYDDWTLPKGKVDAGESYEQAALREVREEASILAEIGAELPSTTYLDRSGKNKHVRYWAMTVVDGSPSGDNEVDVAEWVALDEARARLTYERDVAVVDALEGVLGGG
ncbi:MAG TPA: NUDIX hydrolase [Acidimicrobiales bacterium]|nr:NUDIX hydrolase [Acidimicrobiales bacterium]